MSTPPHPFRFGASLGSVASREEWLEGLRQVEDLGYSTVLITDHVLRKLAPIPALVSAAENTSVRLGTFVLGNDFRNPVLAAWELATLDLLSGGRLEIGIGTGWLTRDYQAAGIPMDPPGERIDRLEETLTVITALLEGEEVDHRGEHVTARGSLDAPPAQRPRPPLLVGGGGRRMLRLAGRLADIVGISVDLPQGSSEELAGKVDRAGGDAIEQRLGWIREGAGDRYPSLELNVLLFGVDVGPEGSLERVARERDADPDLLEGSPHILAGSVDQVCETLQRRRDQYGISYVVVPQQAVEMMGPVVGRLTGS